MAQQHVAKRAATTTPGSPGRSSKIARSESTIEELLQAPPAVRRPQLDSHIVVLSQQFDIEKEKTEKHGYLRGLGNTFTLEVVAEGCEDALDCVGKMLNIDFECQEHIGVVRVVKAPKVHWRGADGRNVTVLSSRYAPLADGATPYEELENASKGEYLLYGTGLLGEGLATRVFTAMNEADHKGCVSEAGHESVRVRASTGTRL